MLKIYIIGVCVLLIAIIANIVAGILGLSSWYDALSLFQKSGWSSMKQLRFLDYAWLFVLYPFLLGLGYTAGNWLYQFISK
jgi:hypothetical protein